MPSRARSKSVESGRSRNAADAASPRGRHAAFYAERDENHDNIEHELSSQTRNLRRLINVKQLMPLPSGQYDSAGAFMNSVGENCEKKRIFICCDGTGNNASGTVDPLTNVAKLARAVDRIGEDEYNIPEKEQVARNRSPDGQDAILDDADEARRFGSVRQIVYYSSGVGTRSVLGSDSLYASAFGKGLSANLLDAYCFICNNYNGRSVLDEIILAGFSRGAFTVRCLARFIKDVGLLRRSGLAFLKTVYKFWKDNAGYEPDEWLSEGDWPENYRNLRNTMDVLRKEGFITGPHSGVRIKVLAEWDTVSAMGLFTNPLSFVGNKVPKNVENAFLAVSLHEKRKKFKPMLWDSKENEYTNVKQCIFAGCHSDIGGGNPDPALSGASFFWMLAQIKDCGCKAAFSHNTSTFQYVIPIQLNRGLRFWKRPIFRLHIQSFAEGRVQESRRGAYAIPYWLSLTLWDGKRDALWDTFLKQHTKEHPIGLTTHITVRLLYERRYRQPAVEKADKGLRCGFFKHFKPEEISPDLTGWRWIKRGTKEKPFLKEDDMGESEKKLFESLLHQAQGIHRINSDEYWRRNNTLRDEENDCNWTRINDELMKGPIFKGCTYENTFVSLLGHTLGDTSGNADDVSGPAGVSADSVGSIHVRDDLDNLDYQNDQDGRDDLVRTSNHRYNRFDQDGRYDRSSRDSRDGRDSRYDRHFRGSRGSRDDRDDRDGRDGRDSRYERHFRGSRGSRDDRDDRDRHFRGSRGSRDSRESRYDQHFRGSRDGRDSRDDRDNRQDRDAPILRWRRGSRDGRYIPPHIRNAGEIAIYDIMDIFGNARDFRDARDTQDARDTENNRHAQFAGVDAIDAIMRDLDGVGEVREVEGIGEFAIAAIDWIRREVGDVGDDGDVRDVAFFAISAISNIAAIGGAGVAAEVRDRAVAATTVIVKDAGAVALYVAMGFGFIMAARAAGDAGGDDPSEISCD